VTKSTTNWIFGMLGLVGLAILLMLGIKLYKKIQDKNPDA
ncbi:MAG: CopD family protein, partial [Dokdonia donghaensis]|nr:CopD family protein [Dokdonia donghaensis]